jgi:Putative transposase DNA-binding domain
MESNCDKRVKKTLKERQYECDCGWNVHRDVNAACNGYKRSFRCDAPLVRDFRNRGVVTPGDGPIRINHPDGDLNYLQGMVAPESSVQTDPLPEMVLPLHLGRVVHYQGWLEPIS